VHSSNAGGLSAELHALYMIRRKRVFTALYWNSLRFPESLRPFRPSALTKAILEGIVSC